MKKFLFVLGLSVICSLAYAQYTANIIDTSSTITRGRQSYEAKQLSKKTTQTAETQCVKNKKSGKWELQVKSDKKWEVISDYKTQQECNKAKQN